MAHADRICHWQENVPYEEMPPVWMWPFDDLVEQHFKDLEAERQERRGGAAMDRDDREEVPMMQNALTAPNGAR